MYCIDFFRKFKKDGNFCGLDKSEVSRLNAYLDVVELLMKQKIPEETVYTHLSVKAARPLLSAKGEERTEALNYVTSQLKEGKKISGTDLQSTMKSWTCPTSEPVVKPVQKKEPEPAKEEKPQKKPGFPDKVPPAAVTVPLEADPAKPPQQSLGESIRKQEMEQADANQPAPEAPAPLPPLSPDAPMSERLKRDEIILGFSLASQLDAAKPIIERAGIKIVPVQLTRAQADAKIREVVRGYLTKAQQGIWEDIRKSGECGDTDLEIFESMIDRMGAA
jgi:hypothetical protein